MMINAADLYTHNLLTDQFGRSKCYVTAQTLRDLDLYPKRRELSIREAVIYLYCLAATPESNVEANVIRAAEEITHIKHSTGEAFLDIFTQIVKEEAFHSLQCAMVSQRGGLGVLEASQGLNRVYFDERRPGISLQAVNVYTQLNQRFLSFFAAVVKERNISFEKLN